MRLFDRGKDRPPEERPLERLRRYTTPDPREPAPARAPDDEPPAPTAEPAAPARGATPSSESSQEILGNILAEVRTTPVPRTTLPPSGAPAASRPPAPAAPQP